MSPRTRGVLVAVTVLGGLGVLVGVLSALFVGRVVDSVRLDTPAAPPPRASSGPSGLSVPAGPGAPGAAGTGSTGRSASTSPSASDSGPGASDSGGSALTLSAPPSAPAGGRVDLTGRYEGASPGAVLQVQRRTAGEEWTDFPVQVTPGGDGTFHTWIVTSRTGPQQFRVVDPQTGRSSPPVDVTIS